jgi:hypothetical protein
MEEVGEEYDGQVVEEVDHEPWEGDLTTSFSTTRRSLTTRLSRVKEFTPEGLEELVDNDEITAEAAFHGDGREKVFKRKTSYDTDNTEIQAQSKKD